MSLCHSPFTHSHQSFTLHVLVFTEPVVCVPVCVCSMIVTLSVTHFLWAGREQGWVLYKKQNNNNKNLHYLLLDILLNTSALTKNFCYDKPQMDPSLTLYQYVFQHLSNIYHAFACMFCSLHVMSYNIEKHSYHYFLSVRGSGAKLCYCTNCWCHWNLCLCQGHLVVEDDWCLPGYKGAQQLPQ